MHYRHSVESSSLVVMVILLSLVHISTPVFCSHVPNSVPTSGPPWYLLTFQKLDGQRDCLKTSRRRHPTPGESLHSLPWPWEVT